MHESPVCRAAPQHPEVEVTGSNGPIVTDAAPCTFRHEGRILLKNSGVGRSGQIQQNSILVISNLTYFSWHILAIGEQFSAF
jgi:hypothetical protein